MITVWQLVNNCKQTACKQENIETTLSDPPNLFASLVQKYRILENAMSIYRSFLQAQWNSVLDWVL